MWPLINHLLLLVSTMFFYAILLCLFVQFSLQATDDCNFALNFPLDTLFTNANSQRDFLLNAAYWEGKFATHVAGGINYFSGLTYDGTPIDYNSGMRLQSGLHEFSAASKECIHLGLLALALEGKNEYAMKFIESSMENVWNGTLESFVIDMLTKKIGSYERFDRMYPGFGGFIPWFALNDTGMYLLFDWPDRVPSLDNGELVWALIAVQQILVEKNYTQLAERYQHSVQLMIDNGPMIFYRGDGRVSCVVKIRNITQPPTPSNYYAEDECILDDPYEGELFTVFLDLFGNWSRYPVGERDKLWPLKQYRIEKVKFLSREGTIEVERGYYHSSHEKWKYMEIPYFDVAVQERVFLNGERARTHFSAQNDYPGLYAAVTNVSEVNATNQYSPEYIGAFGIQELAYEVVENYDVVTPYGAMPLMLHPDTRAYGIVWYASMLKGSKMQGPQGSTEAISVDGTRISPLHTWDSKATTVLAFSGGLIDINRRVLRLNGLSDRFNSTLSQLWLPLFAANQLLGTNISLALPKSTGIANVLPAFTGCSSAISSTYQTMTTPISSTYQTMTTSSAKIYTPTESSKLISMTILAASLFFSIYDY